MNPYPFSALNHLTVPVAMRLDSYPLCCAIRGCPRTLFRLPHSLGPGRVLLVGHCTARPSGAWGSGAGEGEFEDTRTGSAKNGRLPSRQRGVVDPPVAGRVAFGLRLDPRPDRGDVAVLPNRGHRHKRRGGPIACHLNLETLQGKGD